MKLKKKQNSVKNSDDQLLKHSRTQSLPNVEVKRSRDAIVLVGAFLLREISRSSYVVDYKEVLLLEQQHHELMAVRSNFGRGM